MLTQQERPVAFMSRALGVSKLSWLMYAKKVFAIIYVIRTWQPYLFGQKFYIQADQQSLMYLLEQRVVRPEQQKWVAKLLGYDYEILYKPGKENSPRDALSCIPGFMTLNAMFVSQARIWDEIRNTYMEQISKLAATQLGITYPIRNGLILYKNRVVVPTKSQIRDQLL